MDRLSFDADWVPAGDCVPEPEVAAGPAIEAARGDYSREFHKLRGALTDFQGNRLQDYLRGLSPRFGIVWRDMALGYAMLGLTAAAAVWMAGLGTGWALAAVPLAALSFGFWLAYLQLFIHEASHFNIAPTRELNDLLGDLLIGWMVGSTMSRYRIVHFKHHRALGTTEDSEASYFMPLGWAFLIKGITGWRAVEVILSRRKQVASTDAASAKFDWRSLLVLGGGVLAHVAILAGLYARGGWAPMLAWLAGVGVVFPLFGALRQLLEHRDVEARPETDFSAVDHGAYSRMFGDGLFARCFGGAGFNRHLLHHWEPGISYTRLADLERFICETEAAALVDVRRTTYGEAFAALFRAGRRQEGAAHG